MTDRPLDPTQRGADSAARAADDLSGPDTPGPEATPEQEAAVRALLGSLRLDDPPIPEDVVRRIQAVLAEETRRAAPVGALSALVPDPEHSAPSAPVTVLPTQASRRGPSTTTFRWLAGAAAAVVVLGAGTVWVNGQRDSSSSSAALASAPPQTEMIRATGTQYTKAALATQAAALVRAAASPAAAPAAAPADGTTSTTSTAGTAQATGKDLRAAKLTDATLTACVAELAQRSGVTALGVDEATYEGKPVDVVIIPAQDDATTLEVWVVAPGCGTGTVQLYEWRRIPIP